ncbi:hypothetical protein C8J57DRAFT_1216924 [Mycena rebaudengoi]|nr:hypothetical protein C8J57DRAFT_1216924 [Mycena rebaudengoi]
MSPSKVCSWEGYQHIAIASDIVQCTARCSNVRLTGWRAKIETQHGGANGQFGQFTAYYCIDFGLSLYFHGGKDTALHRATLRTFPTIPELSLTVPYNPFYVDIFQLGLTMHKLIDRVMTNRNHPERVGALLSVGLL